MPMQPRPMSDTSRLLLPSLRFCISLLLLLGLARHDLDGRGAGGCADHGAEVRAVAVLRPVRVVDPVVDRPLHGLESDFLCQTGRGDPTRLLAHGGLVPTGAVSVVGTHVEGAVNSD